MAKLPVMRFVGILAAALTMSTCLSAQQSDIKIGQTMPYSGPASAFGIFGKAATAYFAKINDEGGIKDRKINFLSYDDSYSPPKALEQTRKLVEQSEVLFIFGTGGTGVNMAIQRYLNDRKVPQLFVTSGASRFADPKTYPWTIGWQPSFELEARIYARQALQSDPSAKIGILYQNDDFGKEFLRGVEDVLKETGKGKLVAAVTYEPTDPTVEAQVISLKSAGANVFFNVTTPKFAAQAIKKAAEIGWKPTQFIYAGAASISQVLTPAGLENSTGILTGVFLRDPSDAAQQNSREFSEYAAWAKKYLPEGKPEDLFVVFAYSMAQTMEYVLRNVRGDLSRENILDQAINIKGLTLPMLLPGILIETSPTDYRPIKSMQMQRFDGTKWQLVGELIKG
jgi:branched-chain amino acid transport system substrate-binding protein